MQLSRWSATTLLALAAQCGAQRLDDTLRIYPDLTAPRAGGTDVVSVHRPFVGGMQISLVRRSDNREFVPVSAADLVALHLTADQAFALAKRNLRLLLPPFAIELPAASSELSGMRSIEGDGLESSRLLLDDDWRELATLLGGPVVAVAPMHGSLLFGRDTLTQVSRAKWIPAAQFLELASNVLMPYRRTAVLSRSVLRWTTMGWQAVPPMTDAERAALNRAPPTSENRASETDGDATTTTMTPPPPSPSGPAKTKATTKKRKP